MREAGIILFFIFALFYVWFVVRAIRKVRHAKRLLTANARLARGACPACAYDLAGNLTETCSECGHRFGEREMTRLRNIWSVLRRTR